MLIMAAMVVVLVVLDQWTKWSISSSMVLGQSFEVISGFFNITYVRNAGAAFGMGSGAGDMTRLLLLRVIPVLACFWLAFLAWTERKNNLNLCTAYSLILAGAIGNLIDRFRLDYVVDFLDFHFRGHHFPAFNVADSAISIGAALYILDYLITLRRQKKDPYQAQES